MVHVPDKKLMMSFSYAVYMCVCVRNAKCATACEECTKVCSTVITCLSTSGDVGRRNSDLRSVNTLDTGTQMSDDVGHRMCEG